MRKGAYQGLRWGNGWTQRGANLEGLAIQSKGYEGNAQCVSKSEQLFPQMVKYFNECRPSRIEIKYMKSSSEDIKGSYLFRLAHTCSCCWNPNIRFNMFYKKFFPGCYGYNSSFKKFIYRVMNYVHYEARCMLVDNNILVIYDQTVINMDLKNTLDVEGLMLFVDGDLLHAVGESIKRELSYLSAFKGTIIDEKYRKGEFFIDDTLNYDEEGTQIIFRPLSENQISIGRIPMCECEFARNMDDFCCAASSNKLSSVKKWSIPSFEI